LPRVHDAVQTLSTTLTGLPAAIQTLRSQGYLYGNTLEAQAQAQARQLDPLRRDVLRQAQLDTQLLTREVTTVAGRVQSLQSTFARSAASARSLYPATAGAANDVEAKIQGAESRLEALYGGLSQQAYTLKRQVDQVG
jgi:hypothetical protein